MYFAQLLQYWLKILYCQRQRTLVWVPLHLLLSQGTQTILFSLLLFSLFLFLTLSPSLFLSAKEKKRYKWCGVASLCWEQRTCRLPDGERWRTLIIPTHTWLWQPSYKAIRVPGIPNLFNAHPTTVWKMGGWPESCQSCCRTCWSLAE